MATRSRTNDGKRLPLLNPKPQIYTRYDPEEAGWEPQKCGMWKAYQSRRDGRVYCTVHPNEEAAVRELLSAQRPVHLREEVLVIRTAFPPSMTSEAAARATTAWQVLRGPDATGEQPPDWIQRAIREGRVDMTAVQ